MAGDRITRIRIQGLRSLADVTLELDGLTVLIGENGSGKSSILEAFELLRKVSQPQFMSEFSRVHGGLTPLLRAGAPRLSLAIDAEGTEGALRYAISIVRENQWAIIENEKLDVGPFDTKSEPLHAILRSRDRIEILDQSQGRLTQFNVASDGTVVAALATWPHQRAIQRISGLLQAIDVQLPAETRPLWVCKERNWAAPLREYSLIQPAPRLLRLGDNLANCFHALKNEYASEHWNETMDLVRLGLGADLKSVNTVSGGAGGAIALSLEIRGSSGPVPAAALSDGQLAYLAFVAFCRLNTPRSLIGFDEPELHLHPALIARVLSGLEMLSKSVPVVVATHSDRLLDALQLPDRSALLCALDEKRSTVLRRPNAATLAKWLKQYRGLGALRAEGYDNLVMTDPP